MNRPRVGVGAIIRRLRVEDPLDVFFDFGGVLSVYDWHIRLLIIAHAFDCSEDLPIQISLNFAQCFIHDITQVVDLGCGDG